MRRLYTLGRCELRDDESPETATVQPKRLALLTYLAAATPRGFQRRDVLLALFWPEATTDEARRSLRQALHQLRRAIGDKSIVSRADQVSLADDGLWCDAVELERAADAHDHERALALYNGEFLAGVFVPGVAPELQEWIDRVCHRLLARAVDSASRLSARRQEVGDIVGATAAARRASELAPDDESAARHHISLLAASGNPAAALRAFDELAARLDLEYGTTPTQETRSLADAIRRAPPVEHEEPSAPVLVVPARVSPAPVSVAPTRGRNLARAGTFVAAGAALALLGVFGVRAARSTQRVAPGGDARLFARGSLHSRDRIFVARFTNETRDPSLGDALDVALEADLAQSPVVEVLSTDERRDALRRMKRPLELSMDDTLARELAAREGVKAFITADVSQIAGDYVLSAAVVAAPGGSVLTAVRETAHDSTEIVAALGRLSTALRRRIGEAVATLRVIPPLERATTASLPALRAFSRAMYHNEVTGRRDSAITLLERAVHLDTAFASAWRMLGALYAAQPEPARANAALARAFAHSARLPLRDRYLVIGSYNRTVTHDYDKAAAAYRALLETYPTDIAAMNNLAMTYNDGRELERAESMYVRVITADSTLPSVYLGLAQNLSNQGKFAEARQVLDRVHTRFPSYPTTTLTEAYLATAQQDWPVAEQWMRRRLAAAGGRVDAAIDAYQTLGDIALATGRLSEAEHDFGEAMRLSADAESPSHYLASAIMLGWLELRYRHRARAAIARVDRALARFPLDRVSPADRPYADLANLWSAAGRADRVRTMVEHAERDAASRGQLEGSTRHLINGYLALAAHDGRTAIAELRAADAFMRCPVCTLPDLARAYSEAGDPEGAIAVYQRYLRTPWMWRFETDAPNLGWSLERLGELYERLGQPEKARDQYERLRRLWGGADGEMGAEVERVRPKVQGR